MLLIIKYFNFIDVIKINLWIFILVVDFNLVIKYMVLYIVIGKVIFSI